jgi:hypothetical protein
MIHGLHKIALLLRYAFSDLFLRFRVLSYLLVIARSHFIVKEFYHGRMGLFRRSLDHSQIPQPSGFAHYNRFPLSPLC